MPYTAEIQEREIKHCPDGARSRGIMCSLMFTIRLSKYGNSGQSQGASILCQCGNKARQHYQ